MLLRPFHGTFHKILTTFILYQITEEKSMTKDPLQDAAGPVKFDLRSSEICLRHVKFSRWLSEIVPAGQ